ncbi:MAG: M24 family metallopeptidase, partial [Isosphaeraceae bacterium]
MATELHVGGVITAIPGEIDFSGEFDPVLITAADRPFNDTLPVMPDPAADHECSELKRRREDIELKHQRIREFLDANEQDGVVLGRADSVA